MKSLKWPESPNNLFFAISGKEEACLLMKGAGIMFLLDYCFYQSLTAFFLLLPAGYWFYRSEKRQLISKKRQEARWQFKEMLSLTVAGQKAGYSVENAFREAQKELKLIYPETARISKELLFIIRQLRIHVPMEQILEELGMRVQIEDVRNFVTVFAAAKKNGGNMIAIIQDTVRQIGDKIDVKREIETILAAKKYEFRVMSTIPYAIIGYMSLSFPEFMDSLYGNVLGIGVMTVCLGIYMGAYYLGVRMIRIEV